MVNDYFIENAQHWVHEYHLDGLRLDATHALSRRQAAALPRTARRSASGLGGSRSAHPS